MPDFYASHGPGPSEDFDDDGPPPNAAPGVRVWTGTELMGTDFPEPKYAVPGIIPEGLTLLCAPPKFGKSWFVLAGCVSIAEGSKAFSAITVDRGEALYLALEDPPRRLKSRLKKLLAGSPVPDGLHIVTEWNTDLRLDMVRQHLDTHPDTRLVVVDVMAKTRSPGLTGESAYNADYTAAGEWKALADHYGVAVILVHHTRKAGSDDFLDTVSGTNGLAGAADAIIVMRRSRGSADAELHITGREVIEAVYAMRFDSESGLWSLLDGPAGDYSTSPQRVEILQAIREHGPMGPKAISEETTVSHDTVKHLVRRMADDGQLDTDGGGTYSTPYNPVHPVHSVHPATPSGERRREWGQADTLHGEQSERGERVDTVTPTCRICGEESRPGVDIHPMCWPEDRAS